MRRSVAPFTILPLVTHLNLIAPLQPETPLLTWPTSTPSPTTGAYHGTTAEGTELHKALEAAGTDGPQLALRRL